MNNPLFSYAHVYLNISLNNYNIKYTRIYSSQTTNVKKLSTMLQLSFLTERG